MLDSKLSGFSSAQINKKRFRVGEEIVRGLLFLAAFLSVITTFSIVAVLAQEAATFFSEVSFWDFLSGTKWTPLLEPRSFGVLPLVGGTLLIVVGAALIAIPIGLASAIYLAEYSSDQVRSVVNSGGSSGDSNCCLWLFRSNVHHSIIRNSFTQY